MATVDDVLAAIKHVTQTTSDPTAWRSGLTSEQLGAAATMFAASPQQLDGLLAAIRSHHPALLGLVPEHQEGDAADAVRNAEVALAQQSSASAQLDLQVVAAILNAHRKSVDGTEALDKLQRDIETAVRARTDLDTPAGARDFQRFLIGKLDQIRAVVVSADLDDTSKAVLMAAWTSLYASSKDSQDTASGNPPGPTAPADRPPTRSTEPLAALPANDADPYLDALAADDPGMAPGPSPAPNAPTPTLPNLGGGAAPGPGWGSPGGFPLPAPAAGSELERPETRVDGTEPESDDAQDQPIPEAGDDDQPDEPAQTAESPSGPTTITLPNGETVTAASPALAEVIKAAVDGAPIAEAFRQQGISIPAAGSAVLDPVDPAQLEPGDIGMFTTRHALALGPGEALVDGQIQHIAAVTGPSFLGWQHPPVPAGAGAPMKTDAPTPTRPAAVVNAAQ